MRAQTKARDKQVATQRTKAPATKSPAPKPKPRTPNPAAVARARANIKNMVNKRVYYMNAAGQRKINRASARKIMKIARELRRLR